MRTFVDFATLWLSFFHHKDSGLMESRHKAVFGSTAKNTDTERTLWLISYFRHKKWEMSTPHLIEFELVFNMKHMQWRGAR